MKKECDLSDAELIEKCEKLITSLCETGGRSWCLSVPVNFNRDPDMLFSELITRLKAAQQQNKEVEPSTSTNKDMFQLLSEMAKTLNNHNNILTGGIYHESLNAVLAQQKHVS